ncbi:MAG: rhodanese-like domain-containing protein, partial [Oscillospiraceae bacterium]
MATDKSHLITAQQLRELDTTNAVLVDLREKDEYIIGTIPGAINIPFSRFAQEIYS